MKLVLFRREGDEGWVYVNPKAVAFVKANEQGSTDICLVSANIVRVKASPATVAQLLVSKK